MPIKIIYNESRSDGAGVACNWTVPAGVTKVKFEVWGGGGSGLVLHRPAIAAPPHLQVVVAVMQLAILL